MVFHGDHLKKPREGESPVSAFLGPCAFLHSVVGRAGPTGLDPASMNSPPGAGPQGLSLAVRFLALG